MIETSFTAHLVPKRFVLTKDDCTTGAKSQTIELMKLSKGSIVWGVRIKTSTAFAGTNITAVTLEIGSKVASDTDKFVQAYSIAATVADTTFSATPLFAAGTYGEDVVTATIKTTGGNVSAMTAGQVAIDVVVLEMPNLAGTAVPPGEGGGYL